MKRVFWVRGQRRFYGICWLVFLIITFPILNLIEIFSPSFSYLELTIVDVVGAALMVSIALEMFVQRVVVEPWGIQAFDMLNRAKPPLPFDRISSYTRTQSGDWVVAEEEQVYRLPRIDKQQFHAVIAEFAPKALNARLWKCGQLPPSEEFTGLGVFDFNLWMTNVAGVVVLSLIVSFISRFFGFFYFISSFLQVSYDLRNLFSKLSITSQGVSQEWPFKSAGIEWSEITAIFCERNVGRWTYFVVTAPGRSLTIPAHLFADPELRRKFFYNIPDHTRCVNFEKMRFRRRGRGKKIWAGDEAAGYSLDPQVGL